jgi:hypothetical protein
MSQEPKRPRIGSCSESAEGGECIAAAGEGSRSSSSVALADTAFGGDHSPSPLVGVGPPDERRPPFDWNGDAFEVFSTPYFYPTKQAAISAHRARVLHLGGLTVGAVLTNFFTDHRGKALEALATAIQARPSRVHDYYAAADIVTKQRLAAIAFGAAYRCDFGEARIRCDDIERILQPLLQSEAPAGGGSVVADRTIDLSLLRPLRMSPPTGSSGIAGAATDPATGACRGQAHGVELFLVADALHVRDCMREVFGLFHADAARDPRHMPSVTSSAVLVGSPGVGKSVLFFLAALDQARKSTIVYYRHPDLEDISVFFMAPDESHAGHVRVWFTRNVKLDKQQSLTLLNSDIESSLSLARTDYYVFIDGPKYNENDKSNVLMNGYDYFCTSGGRAPYKSANLYNRLWVLDGWSERESIEWLVEFQRRRDEGRGGGSTCGESQEGVNDELESEGEETEGEDERNDVPVNAIFSDYDDLAKKAYWLCGGNMREMLSSLGPANVRDRVQGRIDVALGRINMETIDLALNSTERGTANADRLRTMFRDRAATGDWRMEMSALQIVDSGYVLRSLRDKRGLQDFMTTYNELWTRNIRAPQGCIFELILHQVITDNQCLPCDNEGRFPVINNVVWSQGTQVESVEMLTDPGVLWIPSKQNFPNIDSALVHNGTLYVFQMTVRDTHGFNESTFRSTFVSIVEATLPLTRAAVCFVHPRGTTVQTPRPAARQSARRAKSTRKVPVTYESHGVNMSSLQTIAASLRELFRRIGQGADANES